MSVIISWIPADAEVVKLADIAFRWSDELA